MSERPTTSVVCCLLEGVVDPVALARLIERGVARGVRYVFFRLGRSSRGQTIAASHTGTVVGSDAMTFAWLRALGVLQADTLDELAVLAALVSRPPTRAGGIFIQSGSGGGAGFAADLAARSGLQLATITDSTRAELADCLPANALISNPLDMVGGSPTSRQRIYVAAHQDPGVAVVLESYTVMWPDDGEGRRFHRAGMDQLASAARPDVLTVIASVFRQDPSDWVADYGRRTDVLVLPDLELAIRALAKLYPAAAPAEAEPANPGPAGGLVAEAAAREVLGKLGIPLVTGVEVTGVDAAMRAAGRLAGPFVVKISLPDVAHKGRIDGVRVGLADVAAVGKACRAIERSAIEFGALAAGPATFLVQRMAVGPEILVGLLRDATAGPVLSVGIGGWAAELGTPPVILALPTTATAVAGALASAKLTRSLGATRSAELVDLALKLADAFVAGALSGYETVECNPVMLTASGPVVADVLLAGPASVAFHSV